MLITTSTDSRHNGWREQKTVYEQGKVMVIIDKLWPNPDRCMSIIHVWQRVNGTFIPIYRGSDIVAAALDARAIEPDFHLIEATRERMA